MLGFVSLVAVYIFLFFRSAIDSVFGDLFSVSNYTREAGVRSLERKIGGVCRAVAVQVWICRVSFLVTSAGLRKLEMRSWGRHTQGR